MKNTDFARVDALHDQVERDAAEFDTDDESDDDSETAASRETDKAEYQLMCREARKE